MRTEQGERESVMKKRSEEATKRSVRPPDSGHRQLRASPSQGIAGGQGVPAPLSPAAHPFSRRPREGAPISVLALALQLPRVGSAGQGERGALFCCRMNDPG
jgi:hypothetical protein